MLVILLAVVVTVVVQTRLALERRAVWSVFVDPDSVSWSGPTEFLLATGGLLTTTSGEKALRENLFPPELLLRNVEKLGRRSSRGCPTRGRAWRRSSSGTGSLRTKR
jgi:hypothetical protein